MKRIVIVVALIAVVAVAGLLWVLLAPPAPRAADLLPESTLLFVDAPDVAKSRAEFRTTPLAALWQEPEVQALLKEPLKTLWTSDNAKIATQIAEAIQGEAFLAITHIAYVPRPTAGIVVGADVKRNKLKAIAAIAYMEHQIRSQTPAAKIESKTFQGIEYRAWEFQPGYTLCHAFLNSLAIFTLGENTMRDVITRHAGAGGRSLAATEGYRHIARNLPDDSELTAYLNMEQVTGLLGPLLLLSPQAASTLEKLGRVQASGSAIKFADGGIQDFVFMAYKEGGHKPSPSVTRHSLALTSPQTLAYCVRSMNWTETYSEFLNSIAQAGIPGITDGISGFERALRRRNIRLNETLDALGPETALIVNWRDGAAWPDAALAIELRQTETIRPSLDAVMDTVKDTAVGADRPMPWDESQHLGVTIRAIPLGPGRLTPAYAVAGRFFLIGLNADFLRELITQQQNDRPKLSDQPEYRRAIARLPAQAYAYNYCDLATLYKRLAPLADGHLDKLPRPETVTRHLFPYVSASAADPRSETMKAFSPIGTPVLFGAAAAGAFAVLPTPIAPRMFSDTAVPLPPTENRTAVSQIPMTQ